MWMRYIGDLAVDISSVEVVSFFACPTLAVGACRNGYNFCC
ncbi:hypothetical protein ACUH7Y_04990 [Clostridium beijerinckii]